MAVLFAILNVIPGLSSLINGFMASWFKYKSDKLAITEKGFESAAAADVKITEIVAEAEVKIDAMKVQVYGSLTYRIISLWVGGVCALHFTLIFVDTILSSKFLYGHPVLGVPDAPGNYPLYQWAIISSFFLVHLVNRGSSGTNVAAWLGRK